MFAASTKAIDSTPLEQVAVGCKAFGRQFVLLLRRPFRKLRWIAMTRTTCVWAIGLFVAGCGGGGNGTVSQGGALGATSGQGGALPGPGSGSVSRSGVPSSGATSIAVVGTVSASSTTAFGGTSSRGSSGGVGQPGTSAASAGGAGGGSQTSSVSVTSVAPPAHDGGASTDDGSATAADSGTVPPAKDAAPPSDASVGVPDASGLPDSGGGGPPPGDGGVGWDQVPVILSRIVPPTFPSLVCDVTQYGGVGDGVTDNTAAFASAIAACSSKGGGEVRAPIGTGTSTTYFTGPIELVSNINLNVPTGVTIKFSTDAAKYANRLVEVSFEGSLAYNYHPLVWAHDATNVAITGGGTIDGNATTSDWYSADFMANPNPDGIALRTQNVNKVPIAQRQYGTGHYLRPSLIEFMHVTNILFQDFTGCPLPLLDHSPRDVHEHHGAEHP